jgi:signal transduction histidine kinase
MPFSAIYLFKVYENELVRQTEAELIIQSKYISAIYQSAFIGKSPALAEVKIEPESIILPKLDLSKDSVLQLRPDATTADVPADTNAVKAAEEVKSLLFSIITKTLIGLRITDSKGIVVFGKEEVGESIADIEEVAAALKGQYTSVIRKRESKNANPPLASISRGSYIRIYVAAPLFDENNKIIGSLLVSRSPKNIFKSIYEQRYNYIILTGLLIGFVIIISLLTSYAIVKPIRKLVRKVEGIATNNDKKNKDNYITEEFSILADNIEKMEKTIEERANYIKDFATSVSHEFKTPLTSIRGAIELLQEHEGTVSKEQTNKFYNNILQDSNRLSKLVTKLLELAKADVAEAANEKSNIVEIANNIANHYSSQKLRVSVSSGSPVVMAQIDSNIFETVITNLINNSKENGANQVHIKISENSNKIEILVKDNGSGISENNEKNLFQQFFTTNKDKGGTGLGLSLVRALLKPYNATIELAEARPHAVFKIALRA